MEGDLGLGVEGLANSTLPSMSSGDTPQHD
jgi:hypothetical protein